MPLPLIHDRLAQTAMLFIGILAIWALVLRFRSRPLDGNWFGAAIIGEFLLIGQFVLGFLLFFQTGGATLPRAYLHILYGAVAVIALPAGYSYFAKLEDENVKTVAMAAICFFLWGVIIRASSVAELLPTA